LILYLDASVLASLFVNDVFSERAARLVAQHASGFLISDFAAAEFAAVVGRLVRMKVLDLDQARAGFADFDTWTAQASQRVATIPADVRWAEAILRRLDLNLRAPDALHLAIAHRSGGSVATFDKNMAHNAGVLGVGVAVA
jgi:predicted nucleic acid-binding protein